MTDDIKVKLAAWGAWARDDNECLGCKSPSLMLMSQAPHLDKQALLASKRPSAPFIDDDTASLVDKAMGELSRYSVHLYAILSLHYRYGWSINRIAQDYWSKFEHPCGTKRASNYHVNPLFFEGVGFIGRAMMTDNA